MTPVNLRRAKTQADIDTVAAMWVRSAAWLRSKGSDQWQYPVKMTNIEAAVAADACWLAYRDGTPIGTITLDTNAEPQYWTPEDEPNNALYIHRMVVEETGRGEEIGSAHLTGPENKPKQWGGVGCGWTPGARIERYTATTRIAGSSWCAPFPTRAVQVPVSSDPRRYASAVVRSFSPTPSSCAVVPGPVVQSHVDSHHIDRPLFAERIAGHATALESLQRAQPATPCPRRGR